MDFKFLNKKNFDKYDPDLKNRIQPKVLSYNTDSSRTSWPKLAVMHVCMVLAVSIFTVGVVVLYNNRITPESPDLSSVSETVMQTEAEITYTETNTAETNLKATSTPALPSSNVPAPSASALTAADFIDVLGSFSTSFSNSTGTLARTHNITLGTETINNTILMPGEEFSFNDENRVGDTTEAKGYQTGVSFLDGENVQTFGGGICQVSTTLYNAVIRAGLEVSDRSSHSMAINYVERGMDAAVAYGAKDLVFKNTLDVPVLITGAVSDSKVTFQIRSINNNKNTQYSFSTKKTDEIKEDGKTYHIYQSYRTTMVNGKVEKEEPFAKSCYLIK